MLHTAVLSASLFAVVSATTIIDIKYDGQTYNVCDGDIARVTWEGYHNIQEVTLTGYDAYDPVQNIGDPVHGFENSGAVLNITGLAAQVDQMRYFVCTAHPDSKFTTTCASTVDPTNTTEAATTTTTQEPTTTTATPTTTSQEPTTTTQDPTTTTQEPTTTTQEPTTTTQEPTTTTTQEPTATTQEPTTTTATPTTTSQEPTTTTQEPTTTTATPTTTKTSTPSLTTTIVPVEDALEIPWGLIALGIVGGLLLGLLVLWCYMTCKDYRKDKNSEEREVLLEMA